MKIGSVLMVTVVPMSLLIGCSSSSKQTPVGGYSSAQHEKAMVEEMNLHRPGKTGTRAASQQDNMALRETLAEHPVRSRESQAAGGTVNEMVEGEALPRPTERETVLAGELQQPTVIEERTVVIVPVQPTPGEVVTPSSRESRLGPQDQEVGLRQGAEEPIPGAELGVADIGPYEPDFRQNYEQNYANSGYSFDQYRPAYQYGFGLGKDPRYSTLSWSEIEMQAHRNWNEGTMGRWDRYKDAVRYGWERGRETTPGRG